MINVEIDNKGYNEKPSEFGLISNRLTNCETEYIEWSQFCDLVGNKGHAFLTSDFHSGKRNRENFKSQQIFALDFDGTASFNKVSQIAENSRKHLYSRRFYNADFRFHCVKMLANINHISCAFFLLKQKSAIIKFSDLKRAQF